MSWWWNETPSGPIALVRGLPMSCSNAASRRILSGRVLPTTAIVCARTSLWRWTASCSSASAGIYQPAERRYEVTRGILEEFTRHRGFELGIVTKSNLIVRDLDLLREVSRHNSLSVHVTVTTLNVELARILEPRAPRPDLRIDVVRELSNAGVNVGVSCSPVLPGITDSPADLEVVVAAAATAGARHIFAGPLFLKPCSAAVFLPFLEQHFPHLVENYRQRYQDRAFLPPSYGKRIGQLIAQLRAKHGIERGDPRGTNSNQWPVQALDEQLELF